MHGIDERGELLREENRTYEYIDKLFLFGCHVSCHILLFLKGVQSAECRYRR
jgi:hypothetical protein